MSVHCLDGGVYRLAPEAAMASLWRNGVTMEA